MKPLFQLIIPQPSRGRGYCSKCDKFIETVRPYTFKCHVDSHFEPDSVFRTPSPPQDFEPAAMDIDESLPNVSGLLNVDKNNIYTIYTYFAIGKPIYTYNDISTESHQFMNGHKGIAKMDILGKYD